VSETPIVSIFAHSWQRAKKEHICWLCGDPIAIGQRYFQTGGTVNGKMFKVKHCREKCEIVSEILNDNPDLALLAYQVTLTTLACACGGVSKMKPNEVPNIFASLK
jgi:hypothetical protein